LFHNDQRVIASKVFNNESFFHPQSFAVSYALSITRKDQFLIDCSFFAIPDSKFLCRSPHTFQALPVWLKAEGDKTIWTSPQ
jgi:hypothetical protein